VPSARARAGMGGKWGVQDESTREQCVRGLFFSRVEGERGGNDRHAPGAASASRRLGPSTSRPTCAYGRRRASVETCAAVGKNAKMRFIQNSLSFAFRMSVEDLRTVFETFASFGSRCVGAAAESVGTVRSGHSVPVFPPLTFSHPRPFPASLAPLSLCPQPRAEHDAGQLSLRKARPRQQACVQSPGPTANSTLVFPPSVADSQHTSSFRCAQPQNRPSHPASASALPLSSQSWMTPSCRPARWTSSLRR
jgi:hypothetical protein